MSFSSAAPPFENAGCCLLCFGPIAAPIDGQTTGRSLATWSRRTDVEILHRYFGFIEFGTEDDDDGDSSRAAFVVCDACWQRIDDFHQFCESVREAHAALAGTGTARDDDDDLMQPKVELSSASGELLVASVDPALIKREEDDGDSGNKNAATTLVEHGGESDADEDDNDDHDEDGRNSVTSSSSSDESPPLPAKRQRGRPRKSLPSDASNVDKSPNRKPRIKVEQPSAAPKTTTTTASNGDDNASTAQSRRAKRAREDEMIARIIDMRCAECADGAAAAFATFGELARHQRRVHGHRGAFVECCGKRLTKRCFALLHCRRHINPKEFQ